MEGLVDPSGRPEFFISCERVICLMGDLVFIGDVVSRSRVCRLKSSFRQRQDRPFPFLIFNFLLGSTFDRKRCNRDRVTKDLRAIGTGYCRCH